jgi:hypothetical protein
MSSPYPIWSIWRELPTLLELFFLVLSLAGIYTLFSAFTIMAHLQSLMKERTARDALLLEHSLAALQGRCLNLRQLLSVVFYFWGFVFFLTLPWATMVLDNSRAPLIDLVMRNFLTDFTFAANVFSVLIVVHCVQWFVSRRISACALQLRAQHSTSLG